STFIDALEAGSLPVAVQERLGLPPGASWTRLGSVGHAKLVEADVAHLLLHYDFTKVARYRGYNFERDEVLGLLDDAREVVCITVWSDPARLAMRARARLSPREHAPLREATQARARGPRRAVRSAVRRLRGALAMLTGARGNARSRDRLAAQHAWNARYYGDADAIVAL